MTGRSLVVGAGGFPARVVSEEDQAFGRILFAPLPSVAGAVTDLAHALARVGMAAVPPLLDPDRHEMLTCWKRTQEEAADQPLVVHFCGHGTVGADGGLYLAVRDSEGALDRVRATSIEVDSLLRDVEGGSGGPVLFLLDVCGGGRAVTSQLAHQLSGRGRRAWLIAACADDEVTHEARFTTATTTVLDRLARGWLDLSPALEYVPVDLLAAEIDRELACADRQASRVGQSVVRTTQEKAASDVPSFFRNPVYGNDATSRFLARTDAALRQFAIESDPGLDLVHFATRAAGSSRADTSLFSGRTTQLQRIADWLDDRERSQERLLAVTGGPGSGKSALLGVTVCVTHPVFAPLKRRIVSRVRGFRPTVGAKLLAVHARQLTTRQIITSLLHQLTDQISDAAGRAASQRPQPVDPSVSGPYPEDTSADFGRLTDSMRNAGPVVVILDALDEAVDPAEVLREVLLPLSGHGEEDPVSDPVPDCRVMIGTRLWQDALPSLHGITAAKPATRLDLDTQHRKDLTEDLARDLAEYLSDFMYPHYPQATTDAIAHRLAHSTEHGAFLIAALYADHLLSERAAGRHVPDQQIATGLPCSITEMFDLHTTTLAGADPWIRPVLAALGQARGQGMPLDLIHAVALAHAPPELRERPLPLTLQDTRDALTTATFYLRTSLDDDQRVLYRYFHQALVEHTASATDPATTLKALLDTVPPADEHGIRRWDISHLYLRRHAAAHAAAAGPGALDPLLEDHLFLLYADPDHLNANLHHADGPQAVRRGRMYRTTVAYHSHRHSVAARRSFLALDAVVWHDHLLARTLTTTPLNHQTAPATPQWATRLSASVDSAPGTQRQAKPVLAVTTASLQDGRALVLSSRAGEGATVWDMGSGRRLRHLVSPAGEVTALAASFLPDGRSISVTGDVGGHLIMWDLASGERLRTYKGHAGPVSTIALGSLADRPVAVTGSHGNGRTVVWDLSTGERLRVVNAHRSWVSSTALGEVGGRSIAVTTGGHRGGAVVWDVTSGERLHVLGGREEQMSAVAVGELEGKPIAVTGSSGFGRVVLWDLSSGLQIRTLTGLGHEVSAVAVSKLGGRGIAVVDGGNGQVIVWDLASGQETRSLAGQSQRLSAVAVAHPPGEGCVAVTGDSGGELFLWDVGTAGQIRAFVDQYDGISDIATYGDGPYEAVVTGRHDGQVEVWNLATGQPSNAFPSGVSSVSALAVAPVPEARHSALVGGTDGRVIVWDAEGDRPLHRLAGHVGGVSVAAGGRLNGRGIVVTGGADGRIVVWDPASGDYVPPIFGNHVGGVSALATGTLADGRDIAITGGTDGQLTIWDLATRQPIRSLAGHLDGVSALATASLPDGRSIAVAGDWSGRVIMWDLVTGRRLRTVPGNVGWVSGVAVARLGDRPVAIISSGTRILFWDLASGELPWQPLQLPTFIDAVAATSIGFILVHGPDIAYFRWNVQAESHDTTDLERS
ncbi:AAA family ATPase [Streptomyces sp. NPDC002138]|uniref:AAA family ATPase n=1 Tax=Streptomyces sp. NPDC002138 TaxID=3154410 RepID=UPI0033253E7A